MIRATSYLASLCAALLLAGAALQSTAAERNTEPYPNGSTEMPADPRDISGVWLPDGRHSQRMPRDLPYTPEAKKTVHEYRARYLPIDATVDDPTVGCIPERFPYTVVVFATYPWEVIMSDKQITVLSEIYGTVRRIYLDGRRAPSDLLPSVMGFSTGRWEGNTLVIETSHVLTESAGPFTGSPPTSMQRRFVERWTMLKSPEGFKRLQNEMTVIDPPVLAQPVKMNINYRWDTTVQEVGEYLCQQDLWDQNVDGNPSSVPWRH